jgi:hypothetical protein
MQMIPTVYTVKEISNMVTCDNDILQLLSEANAKTKNKLYVTEHLEKHQNIFGFNVKTMYCVFVLDSSTRYHSLKLHDDTGKEVTLLQKRDVMNFLRGVIYDFDL